MLEPWELPEPKKRGMVGTLGVRRRRRARPPGAVAVRNFVAALVLLVGAVVLPFYVVDPVSGLCWIAILAAYLVCSLFVHAQPNDDNVGWAGGLIDHPFRMSDDLNRWLGQLFLLLLPGRFITESTIVLFTWHRLPTIDEIVADESLDDPGKDIFE